MATSKDISRREALAQLCGVAGVGAFVPHVLSGIRTFDAGAIPSVGVQLYTVRAEMQKDVSATLERVARIGYKEVEFAGYFGHAPSAVQSLLRTHGLVAPSTHVDVGELRKNLAATLDHAAAVGHRWVVVPWLGNPDRAGVAAYQRVAEEFNRYGAAAQERGLRFAYHNHDFEFAPLGDTCGFDVLLRDTDKRIVDFELDLFWIAKAGRKPLEYFAAWPGRFPMVHVKDMTPSGEMVDVGAGAINFGEIFARASTAGIQHFYVEHDGPKDPMGSITASYHHVARLTAR